MFSECGDGTLDIIVCLDLTNYTPDTWASTQNGLVTIVNNIDASFKITPSNTRIALIGYAAETIMAIGLSDGTSASNVKLAINTVPTSDEPSSDITECLQAAANEFANNARPQTSSDGSQTFWTVINIINSPVPDTAAPVSQDLVEANVNVISVTINDMVTPESIAFVATDPNNIVYKPYDQLLYLWEDTDLSSVFCPLVPGTVCRFN